MVKIKKILPAFLLALAMITTSACRSEERRGGKEC